MHIHKTFYSRNNKAMAPVRVIKIIIEGNIGAGKTTILEKLKKESQLWLNEFLPELSGSIGLEVWTEPVETWTNDQGRNLLDEYYTRPGESAKLFQTLIQLQYFHQTASLMDMKRNDNIKTVIVIMERSIYSGRHVFMKVAKDIGLLSSEDYQELSNTFNVMCQGNRFWSPFDGLIYISTDPKTCWERVQLRNRPAETRQTSFMSQSYLEKIHQKYIDWLDDLASKQDRRDSPVRTVLIQDTQAPLDQYEIFKRNIFHTVTLAMDHWQFRLHGLEHPEH